MKSSKNFVGEASVPIIYLGNGAQDSGSPTCAPALVTYQCDLWAAQSESPDVLRHVWPFDWIGLSAMNVAINERNYLSIDLSSPSNHDIYLFFGGVEPRSYNKTNGFETLQTGIGTEMTPHSNLPGNER
jgi:hypothetical protein